MPYEIPLTQTPSQLLGVTLAGVSYILRLRGGAGVTLMDVDVGGERILSGAKCLPNQKILPYPHLTLGGNFYFWCRDNEFPDYTKFGGDHRLLFLTDDEIELLPNMEDL